MDIKWEIRLNHLLDAPELKAQEIDALYWSLSWRLRPSEIKIDCSGVGSILFESLQKSKLPVVKFYSKTEKD